VRLAAASTDSHQDLGLQLGQGLIEIGYDMKSRRQWAFRGAAADKLFKIVRWDDDPLCGVPR
jgi:hypothetical protein